MKRLIAGLALAFATAAAAVAQTAPAGDFHQHLFSPAAAALVSPAPPQPAIQPITAKDLVGMLDEAGIRRAAVLSVAYTFANPARNVADEQAKVQAENDWTSREIAQYPRRLVGFCSVNPLRDYALAEIERCARNPYLRRGLKLHIGNSVVDYRNPEHVAKLRGVFAAANKRRMAIVIHMRASISQKVTYGAEEAKIFLEQVLPAAPDVPVQVAHLAGAGNWGDPRVDEALDVLAKAVAENDPRTQRLWFDVTTVVNARTSPALAEQVARRIRQVGVKRVLYGSDAATAGNLRPREGWAEFRKRVPLTDAEFRTIATNVPPYMR